MILGIDVGGTHTDSVLMKGRKIIRKSKVLTDKENILNCVMMATEAVAKPEDIKNLERIVLVDDLDDEGGCPESAGSCRSGCHERPGRVAERFATV